MLLRLNKWGNHDAKYLNAVMKVTSLAEIRVSVYDGRNKRHQEVFLWANTKRLGIRDTAGGYSSIDLFYQDFQFNLEFAGDGNIFVYKITAEEANGNMKFLVAGLLRWGVPGCVAAGDGGIFIETEGERDAFTIEGDRDSATLVNSLHQGLLFSSSSPVYIRCNHDMRVSEMEEYLKEKRESAETSLASSFGSLKDSAGAVVKGLLWNTFYDPTLRDVCTVISRQWCNGFFADLFGSYIIAEWDTFFAGLLSGIQDKQLAYMQVYNVLGQITEKGFPPNAGSQRGKCEDRSQPPVGAYCVYKLYRQFGEKELLENTYDRLVVWHEWWWACRDGNDDGLLEWGSDPSPETALLGWEAHTLLAAKYESGLDNSPMYDDAVFNKQTHTMELADVGLNSFIALDAWALARIAGELGRTDDVLRMEEEYITVGKRINDCLWCEERGIYLNRRWDGSFNPHMSPTCFYPMLAGIASGERVSRMVREHLLNPGEFWGEYVIPSSSRSEKESEDNTYWRGRIWAPMNFLVSEGLKRYGFHDAAHEFARKSLNLFMKEWEEKGHIHENYNGVNGDGDDTPSSDPMYHWGGLLAYAAISEFVEAQPWGGIRFGNLAGWPGGVERFPIGQDSYSVTIGDRLIVSRNGRPFLEAENDVMLLDCTIRAGRLSFRAVSGRPARVQIFVCEGLESVAVSSERNGMMVYPVLGGSITVEV